MVGVTAWFFASPLVEGEWIKVRGSAMVITSLNPHPTLSALRPVAIPGDANIALTT
jgi:hypothetical protein